jgi:hypothetical protein
MNSREDFVKYIKSVFGPIDDPTPYQERIGYFEDLHGVIGHIAIKFSWLDESLNQAIIKMLQLDVERGNIVIAELSFKVKVDIFSSLYKVLKNKFFFNSFPDFEDEYVSALVKALITCEEKRNQVMHSYYNSTVGDEFRISRKKVTAKQKSGLKVTLEETTINNMFNISDYIAGVHAEMEEFGIDLMEPKNSR